MMSMLKLVFSNVRYTVLSGTIFAAMAFGLLLMSEYIFLEPYVVSHLPPGSELGFILILMICSLSALVLPMNIYRINILKKSKQKMGGGIFGSIMGAAAGACSCGPIGFAVISTFGSVGATATSFLTNNEIPIRIIAIVILVITYFTTIKSLRIECRLDS